MRSHQSTTSNLQEDEPKPPPPSASSPTLAWLGFSAPGVLWASLAAAAALPKWWVGAQCGGAVCHEM